jgi:hypothetical protein
MNTERRGTPPPDTPTTCQWAGNLVTLDSDGAEDGACSNRYPVLYRSSIVDYGYTISVSRFSCLVEVSGVFCLESRSKSGFALTPTGYRAIEAADRAPAALVGLPGSATADDRPANSSEPEVRNVPPPTS